MQQYPGCSRKQVLFTDWNTQRRKQLCAVKELLMYGFHWRSASCEMCSLAILPSYIINISAFLQKSMSQWKVYLLSKQFGKLEKNAVGEFLAWSCSMKTTACNGSREIFRKSENRLSYIVPVSNDPWMVFTSHQKGVGCVAEEGGTGIRTLQLCWSLLRCGMGGGQRARKGHPKNRELF